jgi:hypothetical protein
LSIVALALTNRSKLDSTNTFKEADFWSMDLERVSRPSRRDSVEAVECTWDRNSAGEKVVEERRNLLPGIVS